VGGGGGLGQVWSGSEWTGNECSNESLGSVKYEELV
jgi:hypothetical protein